MKFKVVIRLLVLGLTLVGFYFVCYTYSVLVAYEKGLSKNNVISIIEKGNYLSSATTENIYETEEDIYKSVSEVLNKKDVEIKEIDSDETTVTYQVTDGKKTLLKLALVKTYEKNGLALLKINKWQLISSELFGQNNYKISIPENYKLFINDKLVKKENTTTDESLSKIYEYDTSVPKMSSYEFDFVANPNIVIKDENDKDVSFEKSNDIKVDSFVKYNTLDEAKKNLKYDYNPIEFVKSWSLLMSNDLSGGFGSIKSYMIPNSYLYNKAYSFSVSDALYLNAHSLDSKVFDNEKLSDFVFYSDNSFSCVGEIDKNVVTRGKKVVVHTVDRIFFTYKDGSYKVVDMQSLSR